MLLLEAGRQGQFAAGADAGRRRRLILPKGDYNWGFWTEPEPNLDGRRLWWPGVAGWGGSSSINGMIYIRGHARDYDQWRQMGLTGWGYADVLPYFKRSEASRAAATPITAAKGRCTSPRPSSKSPIYSASSPPAARPATS